MTISPSTIKELRVKTGVGMMDCKRALEEADGNMEEAVKVLRKKGIATAQKKSARAASEGLIATFITADRCAGTLVEVNCETDFVARTDDFVAFVEVLAEQVTVENPSDESAFLAQPRSGDPAHTVKDVIVQTVAKLGENIQFRRFVRYEGDLVGSYIHAGGKIGVLMELSCPKAEDTQDPEVAEMVKDLCMQVAASAPRFVSRDEVTPEVLDGEREIYRTQVISQGKPEAIIDRIVEGKMNKFFGENCLLEQAFVKEPSATVSTTMKARTGDRLGVVRFARFVLGEGLTPSGCEDK